MYTEPRPRIVALVLTTVIFFGRTELSPSHVQTCVWTVANTRQDIVLSSTAIILHLLYIYTYPCRLAMHMTSNLAYHVFRRLDKARKAWTRAALYMAVHC